MASYITITDSEVNPGAIVDSSLMYRMRDNPEAVVEGNATKKIASAAFADNSINGAKVAINTLPGDRLQNNSVSAAKLQDGTVSSSKLSVTTGQLTGTLNAGNGVDIVLPQYTLNWCLVGSSSLRVTGRVTGSATQPGFRLQNDGGSSTGYTVHYQVFT